MKISVGFSPCPNDTFIFYALVNHKFNTGDLEFEPVIEDVEELNRRALRKEIGVTKLSFALFPQVENTYQLLNSGSALGNNCGPLLISKRNISKEEIPNCTVAIPGEHTTANFLFSLFFPQVKEKREMLFSKIEDALLKEETDFGVIIHENRFTYQKKGLKKVADLGELWEKKTNLPIPLGGIFAKKDLKQETIATIDHLIHESILYAFANPEEAIGYVKRYSQEMEEAVMWDIEELAVCSSQFAKTASS